MARASYIHVITTEDPNMFPVVAVATVKHELVTALTRLSEQGVVLADQPWFYVRMKDVGVLRCGDMSPVDPAGAMTAAEFVEVENG